MWYDLSMTKNELIAFNFIIDSMNEDPTLTLTKLESLDADDLFNLGFEEGFDPNDMLLMIKLIRDIARDPRSIS